MKRLACAIFLAALLMAADDKDPKLLPEGPNRELVARVCIDCHGASNFRKVRKDEDEWDDSVADMVDRGAKATPAEIDAVVKYLVANFGKDAKVQMNTAPLSELKMVLGFTVAESQAVIDYREQTAPFKQWRDVLKVPGVDAAKVEAKKDAMAF